MRVLFYGTPEFALPTLEALLRHHDVVAAVTQPDRPAGRGQRLLPPPVKQRAVAAGVPVLQPERLREPGWPERLAAFAADIAVVVAFGQILPAAVLDVPRRGSINVHASLLPRYRGAAPIAWALIRGEAETGITTFQMDAGMDTGAILLQRALPIAPEETAGELAGRLAPLGAEVLLETLERLDTLTPRPQDGSLATLAPRLEKEDGWLRWERPARDLVNLIRGVNPWPGAVCLAGGTRLTIWRARALVVGAEASPGPVAAPAAAPAGAPPAVPGTLVAVAPGALAVATGQGLLVPVEVQPESRRPVAWEAYLRGARLGPGARLPEIGPSATG
jgi:methionyl-tRNA formyltransferase